MKTKSSSNAGALTLTLSGLLLAALFVFTGCKTSPAKAPLAPAATNPAPADALLLRAGDVIKVSFPSAPSLDTIQPIRRDGKITLPLVGEVTASGLTTEDLQKHLVELFAPQIASKEVTVVLQSSSFPVFVTGAVIHPGKILSDHPLTALEAVMEAGGFNYTTANTKDVRVIRNENGVMKKYDLNLRRILDGKENQPFYLKPSDIVFVPERFEFF